MFDAYGLQLKSRTSPPRRKQAVRPGSVEWTKATAGLDWFDRAQLEQAAASEAEQDRRARITGSMFATGSTKPMAEHLANCTNMSANQAIACLTIANRSGARNTPDLAHRISQDVGAIGITDRPGAAKSWNDVISAIWADRKEKTK